MSDRHPLSALDSVLDGLPPAERKMLEDRIVADVGSIFTGIAKVAQRAGHAVNTGMSDAAWLASDPVRRVKYKQTWDKLTAVVRKIHAAPGPAAPALVDRAVELRSRASFLRTRKTFTPAEKDRYRAAVQKMAGGRGAA